MKHQIVHTLQKYLLNPPIKLALAMGLPLPGYALLETTGRKTGKPRRTPVGDGRIGNQFWLVAEHGMGRHTSATFNLICMYDLNCVTDLELDGTRALLICSPTMIRMSVNTGWRISCQAALGMHGRCVYSERSYSASELIWMTNAKRIQS